MLLFVFVFHFIFQSNPIDFTKDPLFKLPSEKRKYNKNYFKISVNNFFKTNRGKYLKIVWFNPEKFQKISKTISVNNPEILSALGATGTKQAIKQLKLLIPLLNNYKWIDEAFLGLAKSMDEGAHRYLTKNIYHYQISSNVLKQIYKYISFKNPEILAPLLLNSRFVSDVAVALISYPSVKVYPYFLQSLKKKLISQNNFTSYFIKVMEFLSPKQKKLVCSTAFNLIPSNTSSFSSRIFPVIEILSKCDSTYTDPRWLALMGNESLSLTVLRLMRKQTDRTFKKIYSTPLQEFIDEYAGSPGWERLLLDVTGKIDDKLAIRKVASYVLSPNLWLREEALSSLSKGTHPNSGRMLHASALEKAGEEAVEYFAAYFNNVKNKIWGSGSIYPLKKVCTKYLRAKNIAYRKAATLALANLPGNPLDSKWTSSAKKLIKEYEKKKDFKSLSGILPLFAKSPSSILLLRKYLNSTNSAVVASAAYSLGIRNDRKSLNTLFKLALSPNDIIAVNATYAIGMMKNTQNYLRKILKSTNIEVVSNAVVSILRQELSLKNGKSCNYIFKLIQNNKLKTEVAKLAAFYLKTKCKGSRTKDYLKWSTVVPLYLIQITHMNGYLNYLKYFEDHTSQLFRRRLNRFHIGIEGFPYKIVFKNGMTLYRNTTFGGVIHFNKIPGDSAYIEWRSKIN